MSNIYKKEEVMDDSPKVQEHEYSIRELKNLVGMISNSVTTLTIDMKSLSTSVAKQEIILEKLANLKEEHQGSISRIHSRIDVLDTENKGFRDEIQKLNETKVELTNKVKVCDNRINSAENDKKKMVWLVLAPIVSAVIGLIILK
jgi:chromosome segregation ATPase